VSLSLDIYFLRHGQTISAGTYTGATDVVLSEQGVSQIHRISDDIKQIQFDFIFCSPLSRCRMSLELLEIDTSCIFDETIREINFGNWENCSFEEIYRQDRQTMEQWFLLKDQFTFPGGENISEFSLRIKNWFVKLQNERYKNVLVVSHAGVIKHALVHLLGFDTSRADQFEISEGSVSLISIDSGFSVLKFLNKTR